MSVFFEKAKFITDHRFADLKPLDVYHPEGSNKNYFHPEELKNIHIKVRKRFELAETRGKCYTLRFTAADYAKVYINGVFVGQGPAGGYEFSYYWNEYDVSEFLCEGENLIEAEVYYQGHINRVWNSGDLRFGFICDVRDGENAVIWTDESWEYVSENCFSIQSTIGYLTQNMENYDSRVADGEYRPVAVNEKIDYVYSPIPTAHL
ncbi:MAG: alpha-L-rhamnosidase, partial [Clostridia bacterium]|nr:alpha-L-rhamnosidase [Clostridia bacterium]